MKLADSERTFKIIEGDNVSEPLIKPETFELSAVSSECEQGSVSVRKEMHEYSPFVKLGKRDGA